MMTQRSHQDKPVSGRIKASGTSAEKGPPARKQPRKITPTYLHNAGLYYLQRFAASKGQFQRVMQRKIDKSCMAHPEQDREECQKWLSDVIAAFQRSGLLNDELYATGAIRSLRQRGLSSRAIEAKMAIKGVPATLVKKTLQEIDELNENDPNLVAALRQARKRRIGPYWPPDKDITPELRDKHLATMARAGFDFDTAHKALKTDKEDADNIIGVSGW